METEFGLFWRYNRRDNTVGYKIKNHRKVSNKLIALPVLGLAAIAATVAVGATGNANADTCPAATCSDTTTVKVVVGAVISLATPEKIDVNMAIPTSSGTFASGSGEIGVSTNDATGYSVYLTGISGDANRRLVHESVTSSYFSPISGKETPGSGGKFSTANTWGWSDNGTDYYPLQAYGAKNTSTVKTRLTNKSASTIGKSCTFNGSAQTNYECTTLTIGATGNTSLTAGTYTGKILVTAVPNSYSGISDYDTDR